MRAGKPESRSLLAVCLLGASLSLMAGSARGEIKLLGSARLPGESIDHSGLTDHLAGGIPHNRLGGISAIDYTGKGTEYLLLPDRGPADGATAYSCRVHWLNLAVMPGKTPAAVATITRTTMLVDEEGHGLSGSAKAFRDANPAHWQRFDPEGARLGRHGSIFLSDEYGPSVFEFSPDGKRTAVLQVPSKFTVHHPAAKPEDEAAHNSTGRQPNGGLEGLAIAPSGKKLYASMQRPLIQDSRPDEKIPGKRIGTNTRIIEFDLMQGTTREFLYPLDESTHGVSEILAINDHEFLVLERDGKPGVEAAAKQIYKIDLAGASDISGHETLPPKKIPADVVTVRKSPFLNLLDPKFGLAGADFPEKIEGLTFGPDLPDGRRLLIVAIDNDFVAAKPILLHAFAIDRADLPGLVKPEFWK
jgi:hypothetical protein